MPAIDFCGVDCEMFINCKRHFLSYSMLAWFLSSNERGSSSLLQYKQRGKSREGNLS